MRTIVRQCLIGGVWSLAAAAAGAQQPQGRALVIGVSHYPNFPAKRQLSFASSDAQEFADFIHAAPGGNFDVHLLRDADATRARILAAIDTLADETQPNDPVYVFFSGHGIEDRRGYAYLMPSDGTLSQPEAQGFRADDFMQQILSRVNGRYVIFFIDACHSGAAVAGGLAKGMPSTVAAAIVQRWDSLRRQYNGVTMGFLSARPHQESWEDSTLHHGVFAWYLLKGLAGEADSETGNGDHVVTAYELNRYLIAHVEPYTLDRFGEMQSPMTTPEFNGSVVVTITPGAVQTSAQSAHDAFQEGKRLMAAHDSVGAATKFEEAIRLDPTFASAYNELGVVTWGRVTDDSVAVLFGRASELDPGNAVAHFNRGMVRRRQSRFDEARAEMLRAIELRPAFADAHAMLGQLLERAGDDDAAIREYREAQRLDSTIRWTGRSLGLALLRVGSLRDAVVALQGAAADGEGSTASARDSAVALLQQLEYSIQAARDSIGPDSARWHELNFLLHERAHRYAESYQLVTDRLRKQPGELATLNELAEVSFTTGRFAQADTTIDALLASGADSLRYQIVLRALRIPVAYARGMDARVPALRGDLANLIAAQPDSFNLNWIFSGTKSFIRSYAPLEGHRAWLISLFDALERGKKAEILSHLPAPRPSLALSWGRCGSSAWCDFRQLNLAHPYFDSMEGVFVIWRAGPAPAWIRVGQGNIRAALTALRADDQLDAYTADTLYVTWAPVAPADRLSVEKYLFDSLHPLLGTGLPYVTPVVVNLPGS